MAGRILTANMITALQQGVVRPVLIARLDIVSDPVFTWTGPGTFLPSGSGDAALDGQTFSPFAPLFALDNIIEDFSIGGPTTINVSGHDLDEDLLRQTVRDKRQWRGQPAYMWLGLLNTDEATVVTDPVRIKTGVMVSMKIIRKAGESYVQVTIDRDLGNAKTGTYRWVDHISLYSGDTWSTYIVALANNPGGLERSNVLNVIPYHPVTPTRQGPGQNRER